jgi:hypothetical protein
MMPRSRSQIGSPTPVVQVAGRPVLVGHELDGGYLPLPTDLVESLVVDLPAVVVEDAEDGEILDAGKVDAESIGSAPLRQIALSSAPIDCRHNESKYSARVLEELGEELLLEDSLGELLTGGLDLFGVDVGVGAGGQRPGPPLRLRRVAAERVALPEEVAAPRRAERTRRRPVVGQRRPDRLVPRLLEVAGFRASSMMARRYIRPRPASLSSSVQKSSLPPFSRMICLSVWFAFSISGERTLTASAHGSNSNLYVGANHATG